MIDGHPQRSRGALRHSGHRPGSGHGPAAHAAGRGLRTGLGTSPAVTPTASTAGLGWNSLVPTLSRSGLRSPLPRPRASAKDRRGSSRRSAALFRPAGFGWGRARRCGTRLIRREPNPASDPRSSRLFEVGTHSRAPFKSAQSGGFPTALVRPRLPRPFSGQNRSLWGLKWPPRLNFAQKTASEGAARPPATRPECPARRKTRGHLLFGVLLPGADSGPRPAPSRPRKRVRSWGRACRRSAARSLNPLEIFFNSPPM